MNDLKTITKEFPLNKEIQQKILDALPADGDIALNNLLTVLAYFADVGCFTKIDRTIWSDANKNAAGYRITVEPQMILNDKKVRP